jgi:hypothetical protein
MRNVDENVNKCNRMFSGIAFGSWGYEINFDRTGGMVERHICRASILTVIHRYLKTAVRYLREYASDCSITL